MTMRRRVQGRIATKIIEGEHFNVLRDIQISSTWLLKSPSFVTWVGIKEKD